MGTSVMASEPVQSSELQKFDAQVMASYPGITSSFSKTLRKNAAYMAYYAMNEQKQGTYPIATGKEFATQVKTGGPWDYKLSFGPAKKYVYNGYAMRGEDLGNVHYGFVGRAAGFQTFLLRSAAGAYQICSLTSHKDWASSYFDDPIDQLYINFGIDMWDNNTIPNSLSADSSQHDTQLFNLLTDSEKKEIEEKVKEDVAKIKEEQNQEK
ncbi:hypothetical protein HF838_22625 [Aneurinibacillus aneurinilyticus]|uniref:Bacterial toxin 44 domain-containing protein n=3 Tax=Aneurinibacillus aneurinilyticus TaxID=1391 RepID=A0A848D1B0_ANEAE|nr:hypothetical protein [Aneurinibacillus aneurinilyticus]